MRAITIRQPWASAIISGLKRVENRSFATAHRGPLAIHAGQSIDPDGAAALEMAGIDPQAFEDAPRGVLLGIVDLVDVRTTDPQGDGLGDLADDPLATGPVCWVLENPRPLPVPIPYRGRQRFFNVKL